VWVTEKISFN